jgi:NodT family efflux transporter outer membrane factor (OMF) lipoprotein
MGNEAKTMLSRTRTRAALLLIPTLLIGGCTVDPDFKTPAAPRPEAGYASDGGKRTALGEGPIETWWTAFGSPDLDALVARALSENHSLDASRATLEQARERIAAIAGRRLPQVSANTRAEYQKFNLQAFGLSERLGGQSVGNPEFDLYTVGGGITYDLDLFGRNRRALEQAAAQAEAQRRETEAAHLVIAGRVVAQVLAIAALNDRIATERALIAEDERNVSLTEARRRGGEGTLVEVLAAQGQLEGDSAGMPALQAQLAEARAMLAVLLGISPAELGHSEWSLTDFSVPDTLPVAIPSALVRKRPDILEAEARLHAAVAGVGMAEAELYPDVTIGASITQSTSEPQKVFSPRYNAFDIFSGLTAPIFDGGTLRANKRGAEAEARAAEAQYRQVVIEAFGQVSTLLSALESDDRELAARLRAEDVAARSLHLSRRSFEVGYSGILQVLDASRTSQRARLALIEARTRQAQNIARLYVATAGGWLTGDRSVAEPKKPG